MTLDVNLMGLGMPPALAARIASGGTGPVLATAKGSSAATAYQIMGKQFVTFINAAPIGGCIQLPAIGGSDMAAEIVDDFVIHNGLAGNVTVFAATGATVNIGGTAYTSAAPFTLVGLKTLTFYGVSATQGFGMSN